MKCILQWLKTGPHNSLLKNSSHFEESLIKSLKRAIMLIIVDTTDGVACE